MRKIKITEEQLQILRKNLSEDIDISNIGGDGDIKYPQKSGELEIKSGNGESVRLSINDDTLDIRLMLDSSLDTHLTLPISKCKEICNFLQKFC